MPYGTVGQENSGAIRICREDHGQGASVVLVRGYLLHLLGGTRVSDQAWQNSFHVAIGASAAAVLGCAAAWVEDFGGDLARITIPVLIMQGSQDRFTPRRPPATACPD